MAERVGVRGAWTAPPVRARWSNDEGVVGLKQFFVNVAGRSAIWWMRISGRADDVASRNAAPCCHHAARPSWRRLARGLALWAGCALSAAGAAGEPIKPIPADVGTDPVKVALGRLLFHDPRLSKDNTVSCASCHDLAAGGDDSRPVSVGVGDTPGAINSPTVYNATFNFKQFWDGRADTLHQQIDGPIQSAVEMGSLWPEVLAKLFQDEQYPALFEALYPDGINRSNAKDAIAEFLHALTTPTAASIAGWAATRPRSPNTSGRVTSCSSTTAAYPVIRARTWAATCSRCSA